MHAVVRPSAVVALITLLLAAIFSLGRTSELLAWDATPAVSSPPVIASEVLGAATPAAVTNAELALSRVTIMPGAAIPVHYHPGTQIGAVVQGELTYTVLTGNVKLYRSNVGTGEPEVVAAGQTVKVLPGDVLVETPGEVHQGRNEGNVPVVIYLSTLFPAGSPRSIIVEATPAA